MSLESREFKNPMMDLFEAMNFIAPSDISQEITDFTDRTAVNLKNPQSITNATNTGANIAYLLGSDSAYRVEYFAAGQTKVMRPAYVGNSSDGTTCTKVIVRGVK